MKKSISKKLRQAIAIGCLASTFGVQLLYAQAPQKMSYQAVIRNASNDLVLNQSIGVQVSILEGSANGTPVYVETHTANTNDNGLVSLEVGTGSVVSGTFASIDWGTGAYFLKTETDPAGGTNYSIVGTTQLLSVPYALYAANSGNPIPGPQGPPGPEGPQGPSGGMEVDCGTSFNSNYVIRGTGSGQWECTNAMVITSTGRVGINELSPSSSYDLSIGTGGFLVDGTSSSSSIAGRLGVGTTSPSSSFDLTIGSGGFLVNSSTSTSAIAGNLRIGSSSTASSTYDLQVDGHSYLGDGLRVGTTSSPPSSGILASGDIRTTGRYIQGSSTSGSGTTMVRTSSGELRPTSSTIRVKENVQNLSFDKNKLLALRPVTYNLKPALGGDFEVGLIAEEVEQSVPELVVYGPARQWQGNTGLVQTDDQGNEIVDLNTMEPYSVHYDRLAVYLLEIIKEQEERIKRLEALVGQPAQAATEKAEK
jgi:hypothetical protein